jgi:hypothetical protein
MPDLLRGEEALETLDLGVDTEAVRTADRQTGRYARRSVRASAPRACIAHGRVAADRYARYTQRYTVHAL